MDDQRRHRLNAFFNQTVNSTRGTIVNPTKFIESVCGESDPVKCVARIIGSTNGIPALKASIISDTSAVFINRHTCKLLQYLRAPAVAAVCGGDYLSQILYDLVDPPIFWNDYVTAMEAELLTSESADCFAWMLLQLISLPQESAKCFLGVAQQPVIQRLLGNHARPETRNIYARIVQVISTTTSATTSDISGGPGGRHDNDFEDFRKIQTLPTVDELASRESPFLRHASEIDGIPHARRLSAHLDNQYRLNREDMLRDLREELQKILVPGQSKFRGQHVEQLHLAGAELRSMERLQDVWTLAFECQAGLPGIPGRTQSKRQKHLEENSKLFQHGSICCLISDNRVIGLGSIWRNCETMARNVPILCIRPPDSQIALRRLMSDLRDPQNLRLVQLGVAVFAYEPILRQLQSIRSMPLGEMMIKWENGDPAMMHVPHTVPLKEFVNSLLVDTVYDLAGPLGLSRTTTLETNQVLSLKSALTQAVCLIQGPPGTGKSFLGSLVAKAIYKLTGQKILVLSYTNHALDQYLEDLLKAGIPSNEIVRLGSSFKASSGTRSLSLAHQKSTKPKMRREDYEIVRMNRDMAEEFAGKLQQSFLEYFNRHATKRDLMTYLEFSPEYEYFFDGFQIPVHVGDFAKIGKRGKSVDQYYLLDRWCRNMDAGVFAEHAEDHVWKLMPEERQRIRRKWLADILDDRLSRVIEYGAKYNSSQQKVNTVFREKDRRLICEKRIIGCTTTAAAKYVKDIESASPNIVIVEEAGEILESHILTAIGPNTKQVILIGDHKQLRPKAHFDLSVEQGTGYDLNRSLFERLVLKGYPHTVLSVQHRMRPEISCLVKSLTYPDLRDAESTENRPPMKGFQSNVVFVNHCDLEDDTQDVFDPRDGSKGLTKKNSHEAEMILKCVKYLAQQGYRSDQLVVLTPYLGQLRLLLDVLKRENDPVLNDIDSHDLVRAGLMPASTAAHGKTPLRISTIDNYQGEESDIVLVSLTRSNERGDIGFMSSPERLNVLLSRARDGLILIGNMQTFAKARKGKELWNNFLNFLKNRSQIYDGVPIVCSRHPEQRHVLKKPEEFDHLCPDGGCDAPCKTILKCGHHCPHRCHQLYDHSRLPCKLWMYDACGIGHQMSWRCLNGRPAKCSVCEANRRKDEKEKKAAYERQEAERKAQQMHEERLSALDAEIDSEQQRQQQLRLEHDRDTIFNQRRQDLENAKKLSARMKSADVKSSLTSSNGKATAKHATFGVETPSGTHSNLPENAAKSPNSAAELEWNQLKQNDGAINSALDNLMQMTGLEEVKRAFLSIREKLATVKRQGTDLATERLGVVLLGNPGTGKTTVARHYANFLQILGLLAGNRFVEVSGSKLANEGVSGTQKMVESILQAGGGAFFIDEAYQLVAGHNHGGPAVLDYLLERIENTTGKIVFILAGYHKQMEKFFQHNPGLESRLPHRLHFADYTEAELRTMLQHKIEKKYRGSMKIEDGPGGLYVRIAVRRLHRGSNKEGFGNARALENLLQHITARQATRLSQQRKRGDATDDFLFTKEDLIGPQPSVALTQSSSWKRLQEMIGLDSVKQSVKTLLDRLQINYQRELREKQPVEVTLNNLFIGSPGTGKTTVAKLYGQILCEIGVLSTSECVIKTPADFIGSVLGQSEQNTKAILDSTRGKVLVIDEAYMFCSSQDKTGNSGTDIYRTAVIDTLVSEVHSVPGEDRAVLLLGYREQMEEMLRRVNPGLARRFSLDNAFIFEDYDDEQLRSILELKLKHQDLAASEEAKNVAIGVLSKTRRRPNFGNAGEVENLLGRAKAAQQKRQSAIQGSHDATEDIVFEPQDFDADYGRAQDAHTSCRELFRDVVGCEDIVQKLLGYVETVQKISGPNLSIEEYIPFNFVFKGPPGTGKTTMARKIGTVFYNMGLLASTEVVECSATDLVGSYVGHTGPKVVGKLNEALGQVLFIDEAYRLSGSVFAKEAIDELVDSLTKPRFRGKLIVVLAGYEDEINSLLRVNPGLSSRFAEEVNFVNLSPQVCLKLLTSTLSRNAVLKSSFTPTPDEALMITSLFEIISKLPGWGNGRDIETITTRVIRQTVQNQTSVEGSFSVRGIDVIAVLEVFQKERLARTKFSILNDKNNKEGELALAQSHVDPIEHQTSQNTKIIYSHNAPVAAKYGVNNSQDTSHESDRGSINPVECFDKESKISNQEIPKDPEAPDRGVSQAQFEALQDAKQQALHQEATHDIAIKQIQAQTKRTQSEIESIQAELDSQTGATEETRIGGAELERDDRATPTPTTTRATSTKQKDQAKEEDDEARCRQELARLEVIKLKQRREEERAHQVKIEQEARERRQKEARTQQKLRQMGICPAGFRWIKMQGGYRCAGGSHFASDQQLGL